MAWIRLPAWIAGIRSLSFSRRNPRAPGVRISGVRRVKERSLLWDAPLAAAPV
jgi:hypothetical protein